MASSKISLVMNFGGILRGIRKNQGHMVTFSVTIWELHRILRPYDTVRILQTLFAAALACAIGGCGHKGQLEKPDSEEAVAYTSD